MTTRITHPEDVESDDEPVFDDGQDKWIGFRVDRTEFPEADTDKIFGKIHLFYYL